MTGLDLIIFKAIKAFVLSPEKIFCILLGVSAVISPLLDSKIKKRGAK